MDFASLMKSQISAAKPTDGGGDRKYLKRSELEAQRQANYLREQDELEKARLARLEKKRKREEEEAEQNRAREEKKQRLAAESRKIEEEEKAAEERERRKRLGLPELKPKDDGDMRDGSPPKDGEEEMDEATVLSKLQELGEPRRLFGESHRQRVRRYQKLTAQALAPKLSNGPIPTTLALLPESEMKVPAAVPSDAAARRHLLRQIASYFDMVLAEWQGALARRPRDVKESFSGKQAANNFLAAKDNLVPLFRKLEAAAAAAVPPPASASSRSSSTTTAKDDPLPDTLLAPILEIVNLAQLKRYVHANDAYLRLSIGKAAWPIGVTMVGIHERSAREKLHESDNKAHIMSDETTRKMLQGMKRCLSFAQTRWPPDDAGQIMG